MSNTVFEEIDAQKNRGILLILTGPSGAGKDTLLNELLKVHPNATKIITSTTRPPRPEEEQGKAHHFLSREEFEHMIGAGELFEWVEFRGELYGTTKQALQQALETRQDVLWRIDMKGVKNIKEKVHKMTDRAVFVFITAPSIEELETRVKTANNGGQDRWKPDIVAWELHQYDDCDYLINNSNDKLDEAIQQVLAIMESKRLEILHQQG